MWDYDYDECADEQLTVYLITDFDHDTLVIHTTTGNREVALY